MAKKEKYLSHEQIKLRVLAYLYNKREVWTNAYTILHRANVPLQEYSRFRSLLEELCILSLLKTREEETGGKKMRLDYAITEKGQTVVKDYRNSSLPSLFGSVEDLFTPEDNSGGV